jgi:TolB-like protein/tetratricopeptide (TPR) repeat protein
MTSGSKANAAGSRDLEVPRLEIQAELHRVLAGREFVNSARLTRFLQLAVERTLDGRGDTVKEFTLGVDVYDRGPDFNPTADSIVRVEAQRLRRKLREYYAAEGLSDPVRIGFRPGSYVPEFSWAPRPDAVKPTLMPATLDSNTVAALPFENLSSDAELGLFCSGITEEIIHHLAAVPGLRVLGLTSVTAMQSSPDGLLPTCRKLGIGTLIEGSVRKSGNRLRVSVKVIGAGFGRARWSRRFDRQVGDIFSMQDEIAQQVALALRAPGPSAAAPAEKTGVTGPGTPAYILYLKGRQTLDDGLRESCTLAIEYFQQSVQLAERFALPYCGLAQVYQWMAFLGWMRPRAAYPKSREAALQALRFDPLSAEGHTALANMLLRFERDWKGAAAAARHALELNPSCGLAHSVLANCALANLRFEEALSSFTRAVELDPLSHRTTAGLGLGYWLAGKVEQAEHWLRVALRLSAGSAIGPALLIRLLLSSGRIDEAIELAECDFVSPIDYFLGTRGAAYAAAGRHTEAHAILESLRLRGQSEYVDPAAIVLIQAALGDWQGAFGSLSQALEERSPIAAFFLVDPLFAPVRSDPRFRALEAAEVRS